MKKIPATESYDLETHDARVIVGGAETFAPRLTASKWRNAAWLTITAAGKLPNRNDHAITPKGLEATIQHRGKTQHHRWAPGSTEWTIEYPKLQDLPDEPWTDFDLTFSPGLTFHKQGPLSAEDLAAGETRTPENLNSWAIYAPFSGRFLVDGRELANYQTGKLAHLYASKLIDAGGAELWLDQDILPDSPTLRIHLNLTWARAARFPLTLDPHLGYDSIGVNDISLTGNNLYAFGPYTMPTDGTATSVSLYRYNTGGLHTQGIYANSSGNPGALLRDTASASVGATGWFEQALDSDLSLTAGSAYWIAVACSASSGARYDSVSGINRKSKVSPYIAGTLPNPFGTPGTQTNRAYSAYATYTAAAPPPSARRRRILTQPT